MSQNVIAELEEALSHGSVESRVRILDHVTNLFLSAPVPYSDAQLAIIDEVFLRLVADIETAARRKLAVRLANVQDAPPNIIRALASDDEIVVAAPILSQSERLEERTIIEIVKTKSQQFLLAVSTRKSLSPAVTDVLVARGELAVVRSTASNSGAKFSDAGYQMLVRRAEGDDKLAERVGLRADIPRHLFLELVQKASEVVRKKLEATKPDYSYEIRQAVAEATSHIRLEPWHGVYDYTAAENCVRPLHAAGHLDTTDVERFANAGQFERAIVAMGILGNLPIEVVEHGLMQQRSELFIIIARAIDLSWPATKAVLSLRSGPRGPAATTIEQCLSSFERLKPATAQQAMRFYLLRSLKSSHRAERNATAPSSGGDIEQGCQSADLGSHLR